MRPNRDRPAIGLPAAFPQVTDQFFTGIELGLGRLITIEIADQTNAERDIVEVIAVNVASVDLATPAVTHFDLAVASGATVANDKMVSQPVFHSPDPAMVIIKYPGVTLSRSTVVYDNEFPAVICNGGAPYFLNDRAGEITVSRGTRFPRPRPQPEPFRRW